MSLVTALGTSLQKKAPALGFWLTLPSAAVARLLLRSPSLSPTGGFSWVLIDAEHGLIADHHYYELTTAVASEGASPIIRVPWGEEWMIKRALDAGAHGVMVPMCHNAEDAARIVGYCKYPPQGSRGYGPMYTPHAFPGIAPGEQYDANANKSLLVVVQLESRSGVENVEKIAAVDGIDVLFIGPFDLAKQMGVERGGEEHEAAIARILKAAKGAGKTAAFFCTNGAEAKRRLEQGFDMVSIITDTNILGEGVTREINAAKGVDAEGKKTSGY
ncbi:hypothetical protein N0V82_005474 [Gnomoniopsis sp. IMI 355080]|nr:hypothetical protein N0V82_005474 [Gnomoniopsis sp. IMI 355080]